MIFPPAVSGAAAAYEIEKSLRFRSNATAYLSRTPGSAGNRKTWTWSGWVKRGALGSSSIQSLFSAGSAGSFPLVALFWFNDYIDFYADVAGTATRIRTNAIYRDPSAWYHVIAVLDTTQTTASNRMKLYVNGLQVTSLSTSNPPAQNADLSVNNTVPHFHAAYAYDTATNRFDGYLSEIHFIDGQALDPTSFGEFDANGVWVPKRYTGTYGTNGFYLPFSNGTSLSTLTADASGNGNNWTATNISLTAGATYDWSLDSPTDNYCVLSNINRTGTDIAAQYGGLRAVKSASSTTPRIHGNFGMDTGKWYFEYDVVAVSATGNHYLIAGLFGGEFSSSLQDVYVYVTSNDATVAGDLQIITGGSNSVINYGSNPGAGSWVGVEYDADNNQIEFFLNGTSQGLKTGVQNRTWFPGMAVAGTTNSATVDFNFGQRPWHRTPTTGFKALSTKNIASAGSVTTSGSFQGNLNAEGPVVFLNGVPTAMTINSNAVTFGTHADKLASGIKVRSSSSSYNNTGSNTFSVTSSGAAFKNARGQGNP